jgi:KUP system potassium uptake protein
VLAYLGQGARLIADGEEVFSNVFYKTIPGPTGGPLYWIMFLFAILATVSLTLYTFPWNYLCNYLIS